MRRHAAPAPAPAPNGSSHGGGHGGGHGSGHDDIDDAGEEEEEEEEGEETLELLASNDDSGACGYQARRCRAPPRGIVLLLLHASPGRKTVMPVLGARPAVNRSDRTLPAAVHIILNGRARRCSARISQSLLETGPLPAGRYLLVVEARER